MARDRLTVTQLPGVDRNRVQGFNPDGILSPQKAFNLTPDRRGGYVPFGRANATGITLENRTNIIGFDYLGISSFRTVASGSGRLQLFKGDTKYAQGVTANYGEVERAAHVAGAGAYISRDQYLLLHRSDVVAEPLVFDAAVKGKEQETGGVLSTFTAATVTAVKHAHGRWLLVTSTGEVWTSDTDGLSWANRANFGVQLNAIAAGDTDVWVVAANNGEIYRSIDNGQSWSAGTHAGTGNVNDVAHVTGQIFVTAEQDGKIFRTTDNGANWTQATDGRYSAPLDVGNAFVVMLNRTGRLIAIADGPQAGYFDGSNEIFYSTDDGATWTSDGLPTGTTFWATPISGTVDTDSGQYVALSEDDDIDISTDGLTWSRLASNPGPNLNAITYSSFLGSYFIVGDNGLAWESTDGVAWVPFDDFGGDTTTENIECVGVNETTGRVVMAGANGLVLVTETGQGLTEGRYKIHVIAYFNTDAGKVAFSYKIEDIAFTIASGNNITVQVPSKQKLIADTLATYGYTPASGVVDDIRVDVYVQSFGAEEVGDTSGGVEPSTTSDVEPTPIIVYDFTEPLPGTIGGTAEMATIGTVSDLPLGSRLGGSANGVTTIVFKDSQTAVHNGRLWGLVSQDESQWPQNDGVSLEIANQYGDFVLGYTETNWANLMRPDNYVQLTPSQSTSFTGMISTPSGLMVMFDNEIFLITGDPALGGLAVELYSDLVGNDLGSTPCKVGGVPFVVWDGQVYALSGGQAQAVSLPVFRQDDRFVQVCPEPQERSLLALTENGEVYRYELEDQFWSNNTVSGDITLMLPHCVCQTGDNTRFVKSTDGAVWTVRRDGNPDTPFLVYRGIDYGDSMARHALYRVQLPVEALAFGATPPRLYYKITAAQSDVEDPAPASVDAVQREEMLEWTLPLGMKSRLHDVKLELNGASYNSTVMPMLVMEYSTVGRRR